MIKTDRLKEIDALLPMVIKGGRASVFEVCKSEGLDLEECRYLESIYDQHLKLQDEIDAEYAFQDWIDGRAKQELHPEIYEP